MVGELLEVFRILHVELGFATGLLTVPVALLTTSLCYYHPSTHIFEAKKRTFDDTEL